ncbi:Vacuolar protein-sorting-associated protein 27 [Microbotryomycetes sp. JL201]|nr:Vacuolar protein-sorting-associated protein 27 [Microbotryomycetes sp. JL201]
MSFLWGPSAGQAEFDALLDLADVLTIAPARSRHDHDNAAVVCVDTTDKTTSDLLPSNAPPDLVASLELADLIRSTAVPPQAATKAFLRRLKHPNPNVQLLALGVLDICVKNGGTPFLVQVGAKECANELEQLGRGTPSGNRDVKERVLSKVQDWATAFQGKDALRHSELVRTYERMRNEGLPFPARDPTATAAMVDSLSAPEWKDAPYCTRCRTEFTTFNRKHHCRNCGDVFDQQCSSNVSTLPHYGITEPVRVCDGCIKKIKEGKGASVRARSASLDAKSASKTTNLPERSATVSYGSKSSRKSKEDDDLQRAIEASLRDVAPSASNGPLFELRNPNAKPPTASGYNPTYSSSASKAADEDDPDLAAAIAASLRDVAPAPSAPVSYDGPAATYASMYGSNTQTYSSSVNGTERPRYSSLPSYDLTSNETMTLAEFASTLDRTPQQSIGSREHELFERAQRAAPRLERGLEDAERRREILMEMNAKLSEATRLYQGLLEEGSRNRSSYTPHSSAHSYYTNPTSVAPPQPYTVPHHYEASPHYQYVPPSMGQPLPFAPAPVPPPPMTVSSPIAAHQQHVTSPPIQYHEHAQFHAQQYEQAQSPSTSGLVTHDRAVAAASAAGPLQQPQPPQPAGFYKPSSFPSVPTGPSAALFPSVPKQTPWEQEQERLREQDEERQRQEQNNQVGELIEL